MGYKKQHVPQEKDLNLFNNHKKPKKMKNSNVNFKQTLRQDDVFVPSEVKSLTEMTGLSTISSKSHAIICGDQIVNVVSEKY